MEFTPWLGDIDIKPIFAQIITNYFCGKCPREKCVCVPSIIGGQNQTSWIKEGKQVGRGWKK